MALTLAVFTVLLTSQQANAEEARFLGPRIEALVGYDATELPDEDGPEVMFGVRGGNDFPLGKWRVGFDAELSRSNADKVKYDVFEPDDRIHVRYGTDIYLGVRAAYTLGGHLLSYGMAGGARSHMKVDYSGDLGSIVREPGGPQPAKFTRPGDLFGFWTGGGLELALGNRSFVRTEYRYSNFHDGLYRHQAVLGVGIRL
jgi:outer membrane immunogenic protein